MSRGDGRALEAATQALEQTKLSIVAGIDCGEVVKFVVSRYLDALLSELPEEAVEAMTETGVVGVRPGCTCPEASYGPRPDTCRCDERAERFVREKVEKAATAFLLSLRFSLRES